MKKTITLFLTLCVFLCLVACDSAQNSSSIDATQQLTPQATATPTPTPTPTQKPKPTATPHKHKYDTGTVTKEATCGKDGTKKFTCECGYSYTDTIDATEDHVWTSATCAKPKTCKICGETSGSKLSYHEWEYATCLNPKTCKVCGETDGTAKGHSYYSDGKCGRCDEMNPVVTNALANSSLSLPSLPKTVSYYPYSGKKYSSVDVTNITSEIECNNDGYLSITVYFSGTKTYDYQGSGQSDSCKIGWKLYAPDGSVIDDGTFYSPSIKVGESFSNKECTVLSSYDKGTAGNYRLEILNVN